MVLTQPEASRPRIARPATRSSWGLVLAGGLLGIVGTI
jgi:hypothetical protein